MASSDSSTAHDGISKYGVLYRYRTNPIFRLLVRKLFSPWHFMNFFKAMEARVVLEYLNVSSDEKICDVACGCGEHSVRIANKGGCVCGLDMNEKAAKTARILSQGKCSFIVSDAEKLPFKSNSFDKAVSVCALEHFENDDRAIQEMSKVLKPGGILVLTVDSFAYKGVNKKLQARHKVKSHVVNYYSLPQLSQKLEQHGFQVEKAKYLVSSPLAAFFLVLLMKNRWLGSALFPMSYPLSLLSDRLAGERDGGYFLAVRARKADEQ